jgi:siroheme synthase
VKRGSLVVVGAGIKLASQCTPEARQHIEAAEIVFAAMGDPVALAWLQQLNPNVTSLHSLYGGERTRSESYAAMADAILAAVREGKEVCAVFYGHPGVFVDPSHEAIRRARAEGFEARMLPGVSAEDCLYADLGVDPGRLGCQSYEATDFLIHARRIDTSAALILWQIALAGEPTQRVFEADPRRLALLADVLMQHYPAGHIVTVYEAATLPIAEARMQPVRLDALHSAEVSQQSTLYVPPLAPPQPDPQRLALLKARL